MPNPITSSKSLEEMWAAAANYAALMTSAQATGMTLSPLDPSDPLGSMNTLLAAAQSQTSTLTRTPLSRSRPSSSKSALGSAALANREALMAAAQTAGVSLSSLDPSDPLCSKNDLLEAAQAQVSTLTRPQRSRSRPFLKSSTVGAAASANREAKGLFDLIPLIKRAKRAPSKVQNKASTTSYNLDSREGKDYQNSKHNFFGHQLKKKVNFLYLHLIH